MSDSLLHCRSGGDRSGLRGRDVDQDERLQRRDALLLVGFATILVAADLRGLTDDDSVLHGGVVPAEGLAEDRNRGAFLRTRLDDGVGAEVGERVALFVGADVDLGEGERAGIHLRLGGSFGGHDQFHFSGLKRWRVRKIHPSNNRHFWD